METGRTIAQLMKLFKDTIFPAHCFGCDAEGKFVCDDCYGTLDISGMFCCPVCHAKNDTGKSCISCATKIAIDQHVAITPYQEDGLIGDMMHSFKYHFAEDVRDVFDRMMSDFLSGRSLDVDIIIPVPLHKKRYVERGFNQSEIIAQTVARVLQVPIEMNRLVRSRYTVKQAKLKREERLKNLTDAFEIKNPQDLVGKKVLVVDDVFTTGSTVNECAKALKLAGAGEVISFSIARG
jgi:ComF family protein